MEGVDENAENAEIDDADAVEVAELARRERERQREPCIVVFALRKAVLGLMKGAALEVFGWSKPKEKSKGSEGKGNPPGF